MDNKKYTDKGKSNSKKDIDKVRKEFYEWCKAIDNANQEMEDHFKKLNEQDGLRQK